MNPIWILTDSTVQFTKPMFTGRKLVNTIPLQVRIDGTINVTGNDVKVADLPASLEDDSQPALIVPTVEEFRDYFETIGEETNEAIAILHSGQLSSALANAQAAAETVRGRISVQVIDSQTISVGLGYLVQIAANAAFNGARSVDIERLIRKSIPHIYGVFCIPNLSYLYHAGFVGQSQAMIGEMLGLFPLFTLEEGHLTPVEKVRNYRQLLDYFQEFVDEFTDLNHIALIQSTSAFSHEARALKDHISELFQRTPFSEYPLSLPLAALFGPRSLGLFTIESVDE